MTEQNNIYHGVRVSGGVRVTKNGQPLPLHLEVYNHSPSGFNYGYGGSGPAQLALAIMVEEYGPDLERHPVHYMELKDDVIAEIQDDEFEITSSQLHAFAYPAKMPGVDY